MEERNILGKSSHGRGALPGRLRAGAAGYPWGRLVRGCGSQLPPRLKVGTRLSMSLCNGSRPPTSSRAGGATRVMSTSRATSILCIEASPVPRFVNIFNEDIGGFVIVCSSSLFWTAPYPGRGGASKWASPFSTSTPSLSVSCSCVAFSRRRQSFARHSCSKQNKALPF